MEKKKVELKVNVINQLRLLRQSTFKDPLCFLDEDIQNAQRAKASEVRIDIDSSERTIVIRNNGKLLDDPQSLFSIAESGWDEDVKKSENPFGMGFFSNISVSNLIVVRSGDQLVTFDVEKMINTGDTNIQVEKAEEPFEGFELTLKNFDFNTIYTCDIRERIANLGKYIHELDIYCDGELQKKKNLTEGDNSPFQMAITDEKDFQGWIALAKNTDWGCKLNVFYKGRLVSALSCSYLKGDLHVSDRVLNLTSPDRKDIINDEKYYNFKALIKLYAELLSENTLLNHSEYQINEYTDAISYYIDKRKMKNKMKFRMFNTAIEKDYGYLSGIALAKSKNPEINSFAGYEMYLDKEAKDQPAEHFDSVDIKPKPSTSPSKASGMVHVDGCYSSGYTVAPIEDRELVTIEGETIENNEEPVFYINFGDMYKYEAKLNVAKHYALKIIVARNSVEEAVLKSMRDSDNIIPITELDERVDISGNLSDTTLSVQEQRAMMLFDMVSRIAGYSYNVFEIGNLMVTRNIKVPSLNYETNVIDEDIVVLKDYDAKKIYVDRSTITKQCLRSDTEENLDVNDYKFILNNLFQIDKELRLLNPGADVNYLQLILSALGSDKLAA